MTEPMMVVASLPIPEILRGVRLVLIVVVTRAKTVILVCREAEDLAVEPVQLFLRAASSPQQLLLDGPKILQNL